MSELNEAYNHFFFHYSATPLLVVETSQFDLSWGDEAVADIERQIRGMGKGTRYYVPDVTLVESAVSSQATSCLSRDDPLTCTTATD